MDDPNSFTTQDYELYPDSDSFADPMFCRNTDEIQRQFSQVDHTMKTAWFPSMSFSTPGAHLNPTSSPFSMEGRAYPMVSDISSPFGGGYASSGADSPPSRPWANIGCYMSPPSSCADSMLPPLDPWDSCSPGPSAHIESSVSPSQIVQNYPMPIPIADLDLEPQLNSELDPQLNVEPIPANEPMPVHHHEIHPHSKLDHVNSTLGPFGTGLAPDQGVFAIPSSPQVLPAKPASQKRGVRPRLASQKGARKKDAVTSTAIRVGRTLSKSKTKKDTRPQRTFVCTFARYGCTSSFASKNEWKRHVTSQHLQLGIYRCDVGQCDVNNPNNARPLSNTNDFNRKDLFTQHQRRMHTPWAKSTPTAEEKRRFEADLEAVQIRCWHEQRHAPSRSACGFCGAEFAGYQSWNQRMEHVGRHYEKGDVSLDVEKEDIALRDWAIQEGILSWSGGRWRLVSRH
ncbi:hypothetical protein BDV26DRAFT_276866 [Aspergillus bertholletiae]|uniref:C2H2 finger domain protein n=1 Tax=Aspergillus bertholletiae TaxID=1226010 RepID=A0A5N7APV7_9EURO|nr:hypothetical protein BDV26DRAFT_276866 [Aspergillus bertholletiae]